MTVRAVSSGFQLFADFDAVVSSVADPDAADLFRVLERMRTTVQLGTEKWSTNAELVQYARICFWAIRKLEYSFAVRSIVGAESAQASLRVLDVGCGVVPLCNWMSTRGHHVTAIDPASDVIEFLVRNDLNNFYGSHVDFEVGRAESLRFPDASFDVVTCISVLEHIAPGNDRLALHELARVLKPNGALILTFDVAPQAPLQPGEVTWPSELRRYAQPFSPDAVKRLLDHISDSFDVGPEAVPAELRSLGWEDVHSFWSAAVEHDRRVEPVREYVAMGGVLIRRPAILPLAPAEVTAAYHEGQQALEERLGYFQRHAHERLQLVQRLDARSQRLQGEVEEKERVIANLGGSADERPEPERGVHLKLAVPGSLRAAGDSAANEIVKSEIIRLSREVDAIHSMLARQQSDLGRLAAALSASLLHPTGTAAGVQATVDAIDALRQQVEAVVMLSQDASSGAGGPSSFAAAEALLSAVRSNAEAPLHAQLRSLEREKELAEAAADARLLVIEDQKRAIEAYQRARLGDLWQRWTGPRIGVLYQYPPRVLHIPSWYGQVPKLQTYPTFSIVTPSLNQGRFIERTLQSVLDQKYPALEYIVRDGASHDETLAILERTKDSLTHVVSEPDSGFADAINRGFSDTHGELLAYLNSDDMLLPGSLHYIARFFQEHPDVDVIYGHRAVIDEYDGEVGRWVLPGHDDAVLSWADYVPQETLFWRRRIWEKIGATIDESFRFAIDWDLLLRFRDAGARMRRLPRFLGAFRVHPHQKTSSEMAAVGIEEMDRLRRRALGRSVAEHEIGRALAPYLRRHFFEHRLYRLGLLRY